MVEFKVKHFKGSQFVTAFSLRPRQFAWLLGAGTSASAGIPTGYMMIRDFKTRLFCQESGLPLREIDSSDPLWVQRIDSFFLKRSILPPTGDPSEYSAAFEALYPSEDERRQYIEDAIRRGTPSFAHRVLASLISTKHVPCIFTTNFDPLIEIASTQSDQLLDASDRAMPTVAALDSVDRAERCLRESAWPLIAKLHGDYQSTKLKNTAAELMKQDEKMRAVLAGTCQRFGLVVAGYSGRDSSVMEALENSLQTPGSFPSGIYWVTRSKRDLLPAVQTFLHNAAEKGVNAVAVESQNFDELAAELVTQFELPTPLQKHIFEARPTPVLRPVPLPTGDALKFPVLRCSALLIEQFPKTARRLKLANAASTATVRTMLREAGVYGVVASTGLEVAAFGVDSEIETALAPLGARLDGDIVLNPDVDSWALGLLYDALTRALCRSRPLSPRMRRAGHAVLVARGKPNEDKKWADERRHRLAGLQQAYGSPLGGSVPGLGFQYSEGIRLRLEMSAGRWWCVFDPFTFVDVPRADEEQSASEKPGESMELNFHRGDPAADWRRERWATKYNFAWAKIIDAWAHLLSSPDGGSIRACGVSENAGVDAVFSVSNLTAWSRPGHQHAYFERRR